MNKTWQLLLITALVMLAACKGKQQAPGAGNGMPNLNKKLPPVMVEQVEPQTLQDYIEVSGKLEGVVDVQLLSQTSGTIVELHKALGDWVEKGQAIGRVDNEAMRIGLEQAKANLLAAQAALEAAQLNMSSAQRLYDDKNMSAGEFAQAKSNFKTAKAAADGAEAGVESSRIAYQNSRFGAPVSGYITSLNVQIGEVVNPGNPICRLVNSRRLVIKTGVSQRDVVNVHKGQQAIIIYDDQDKNYDAVVRGVGFSPDPVNYPLEVELDNPKSALLPGMVVNVRIPTSTYTNVTAIEYNSIVTQYDASYVFVIEQGDTAVRKAVTLGNRVGKHVIVASGLSTGQTLIVEGMENLETGTKVEVRKAAKEM